MPKHHPPHAPMTDEPYAGLPQKHSGKDQEPSAAAGPRDAAFAEAIRIAHQAAQAGFDWEDVEGPLAKVEEEIAEVREALTLWRTALDAAQAAADPPNAAAQRGAGGPADAQTAAAGGPNAAAEAVAQRREALVGELGDLLFAAFNACRLAGVHPGDALHSCNERFAGRFEHMRSLGLPDRARPNAVAEWDRLWQQAKLAERQRRSTKEKHDG